MGLVLLVQIIVIAGLVYITMNRRIEAALPFFVFVVVFVPAECRIQLPFFTLTTQRVALLTLSVLYFAYGGKSKAARSNRIPLKSLLIIHILWCCISTANSVVVFESVKKMLSVLLEYYLTFYIISKTVSSTQTIYKLLTAMAFAVAVSATFGSYEAYTGWQITSIFPASDHRFMNLFDDDGRGARVMSTFGNYSLYGSALALAIVQSLGLIRTLKRFQKAMLWVGILLMFLCIYKTASRGPWLTLIIGFSLFIFVAHPRSRRPMLAIVALTAAVLIIRPGVYDSIENMYVSTLDTDNPDNVLATSYEYRYVLRKVVDQALSRSPSREIMGYGMESFFYLDLRAPFYNNPSYHFLSCDSSWLELLEETGYVGLAIVGTLLILPVLITLRKIRRIAKPDRPLYWLLVINMLQYYFMMTNVALYAWGQTGYMLWIVIALAVTNIRPRSIGVPSVAVSGERQRASMDWFGSVHQPC